MIEVKTADLIGPALDWAVAQVPDALDLIVEKSEYLEPFKLDRGGNYYWLSEPVEGYSVLFRPSTDWAQGGPLIEEYKVELLHFGSDGFPWEAQLSPGYSHYIDQGPANGQGLGETPLIAACRAIVADKIGDTVMIPKELMQ